MSDPGRTEGAALRPARLPEGRSQVHLVGFMGSGKSTVGRLVARELLWNFLDLDALVARHAGKPVPRVLAEDGEEAFRAHERHALRQAVQKPSTVLALGGGAFVDPVNRALSARVAASVWLRCCFEVLAERIGADAGERPLWVDPAAARELLRARESAYAEADHVVDAGPPPEEVAAAVIEAVAPRR